MKQVVKQSPIGPIVTATVTRFLLTVMDTYMIEYADAAGMVLARYSSPYFQEILLSISDTKKAYPSMKVAYAVKKSQEGGSL